MVYSLFMSNLGENLRGEAKSQPNFELIMSQIDNPFFGHPFKGIHIDPQFKMTDAYLNTSTTTAISVPTELTTPSGIKVLGSLDLVVVPQNAIESARLSIERAEKGETVTVFSGNRVRVEYGEDERLPFAPFENTEVKEVKHDGKVIQVKSVAYYLQMRLEGRVSDIKALDKEVSLLIEMGDKAYEMRFDKANKSTNDTKSKLTLLEPFPQKSKHTRSVEDTFISDDPNEYNKIGVALIRK